MTDENDTLEEPERTYTLEDLVQKITNDAMGAGVKFEDRVDALKAITTYHLGMTKLKGKNPDDDDNVTTFESIKNRIKEAG